MVTVSLALSAETIPQAPNRKDKLAHANEEKYDFIPKLRVVENPTQHQHEGKLAFSFLSKC